VERYIRRRARWASRLAISAARRIEPSRVRATSSSYHHVRPAQARRGSTTRMAQTGHFFRSASARTRACGADEVFGTHNGMRVSDQKSSSTANAIMRGALGRCPCCGQGRILHHYLKIVAKCSVCGEPYGHFRADDAPPWLTILVVGHITIPIVLAVEQNFQLTMWIALAIYLPLIALLTLVVLPRCKGVIVALLWAMKAEGSEKT